MNPLLANQATAPARARPRRAPPDRGARDGHRAGRRRLPSGDQPRGGPGGPTSSIAAGAGTRALAAMVGVRVPAEAEPLHMNVTEAGHAAHHHLVQHADRQITLKQLAAGQVVIGGGWPARLAGADEFPTVEAASLVGNVTLAQHVVPRIGRLRLIRTWAGINTTRGRPSRCWARRRACRASPSPCPGTPATPSDRSAPASRPTSCSVAGRPSTPRPTRPDRFGRVA